MFRKTASLILALGMILVSTGATYLPGNGTPSPVASLATRDYNGRDI